MNVTEGIIHMGPVMRIQNGVDMSIQGFIDIVVWQFTDHDRALVRVQQRVQKSHGMSCVGADGLLCILCGFPDFGMGENWEILDMKHLDQIFLVSVEWLDWHVRVRLADEVLVVVDELGNVLVQIEPFGVRQVSVVELGSAGITSVLSDNKQRAGSASFGSPGGQNLDSVLLLQLDQGVDVGQHVEDVFGLDVHDVDLNEGRVVMSRCHGC